jgi:hypothetical protein
MRTSSRNSVAVPRLPKGSALRVDDLVDVVDEGQVAVQQHAALHADTRTCGVAHRRAGQQHHRAVLLRALGGCGIARGHQRHGHA